MKAYLLKMDNKTGETELIEEVACLQYQSAFMLFEDSMILQGIPCISYDGTPLRDKVRVNRQTYTNKLSVDEILKEVVFKDKRAYYSEIKAVISVVVKEKAFPFKAQYLIVCAKEMKLLDTTERIINDVGERLKLVGVGKYGMELTNGLLTNRGIFKLSEKHKLDKIEVLFDYDTKKDVFLGTALIRVCGEESVSENSNIVPYTYHIDKKVKLYDAATLTQDIYDAMDSVVEKCKKYN